MDLLDTASWTSDTLFWAAITLFAGASFCIAWLVVGRGQQFYDEYEDVFKDTATTNLDDMFLFIDPQRLFLINLIALIVLPLLVLTVFGDPLTAAAVFLIILIAPLKYYKAMRKKRLKTFERQFPDALTMISGSLAAGASLNMAIESLVREQPVPLAQEFLLLLREQRIGVDFEISLRNMERRLPLPDFVMFSAALRISREIGGNLGETLDLLADTLRRKATMEGKIDALTAQGRMQGYVMTALPIFLGTLLFFLEPEAMSLLFTTPQGWGTLAVVLVMEALGYVFIRKVTNIDV
ncbi:MAG TPA: type II secretion system F family protein [Hyphomicrobiales bacterium]|nr:type II secretion system F family protein [Hyphomicrobiales bacterium]